jgi:hypothetical protein
MKNTINYDVQGSLEGKQQARVQRKFAKDLDPTFRGYKIDEFQINATITSQKEFDDFMLFIETIRPCMSNGG